ncbi:MAG: hypothetical protein QG641_2267 [Candidatus Poribacteria bacterium]|nr:hypothetical protein [Candidatus Poribacteria bacterium]
MKITFFFWNINKKPIQSIIRKLALYHQVDVIMLAECDIHPGTMLSVLNQDTDILYDYALDNNCKRINIYTRFPSEYIETMDDPLSEIDRADRLSMRHLKLPGLTDISLLVTHFVSKDNWTDNSQSFEWYRLSDKIKWFENSIGHSRTVLVGDLNTSPFESGVISAGGLHGTMSRIIADRKTRAIQGKEYPFFYNPMWNFLGDFNSETPGTYYYPNAEHEALFWHAFDQVLIRPDLLSRFDNEDLKILTSDGEISFLNESGIPDKNVASDHLPLLFKLDL